jgi:pyruvate dehydrogenase E1 component alpha subunit
VHRRETMADDANAQWARGHGVPVEQVDGNDVEAVHAAASRAVAGIRADGHPRFLELVTYRMRGHYEPDDQSYVDPAELERWRQRDPIRLASERLLAEQSITPAGIAAMEQLVAARIEDAAAFAQASPWPSPQTLTEHVYA